MDSEAKVILDEMEALLLDLQNYRPLEKSDVSRAYAVTITEFEKVIAYFEKYVVRREK